MPRTDDDVLAALDWDRPTGQPFEHTAAADRLYAAQEHISRLLTIAHEELSTRLPRYPHASRLAAREVRGRASLREAIAEDTALVEAAGDGRLGVSLREALADLEAGESRWTSAYYRDCYAVEAAAREATAGSRSGAIWLGDEEEVPDGWVAPSRDEDRFAVCGRYAVDRAEPVGTPVDDRLWHLVLYDSAVEGRDPWRPWSPMWSSVEQVVAVLAAES